MTHRLSIIVLVLMLVAIAVSMHLSHAEKATAIQSPPMQSPFTQCGNNGGVPSIKHGGACHPLPF